ncbi:hypothetical protein HD554DRAFT_389085 [Boletus coccyginus]|nr:hypothetical protein HD554DRAFT_389085 [Boletus coccyginus]
MGMHSRDHIMGNLGILTASCAGICSPCKLYDVQCLCNITIWQGGPERTGALPGALPCYAFGCPTVLPPISAPLFRFHMSSAPRARRLAGPRSGLAEGTPGPSDRTLLHSQPPVTCASLCNVFFILHRYCAYAASSIPPIICFIHTLQSRLVSFISSVTPFCPQIYISPKNKPK